jgi:thiamine-phosphate pyrophosphorylase
MRPLPRLHAITDERVAALPDLGVRAAAIAAAGPAAALHARGRALGGDALGRLAARFVSLATPPEAAVFVNARPDIAAALGAHGVMLGTDDLGPADARRVFTRGWVGRSVHDRDEARRAVDDGADFLMVGSVFESASHPGRPAAGLPMVEWSAGLGKPVVAIGGMTPERAGAAREAGAWGVAAITALWDSEDPYAAAVAFLEPWSDG